MRRLVDAIKSPTFLFYILAVVVMTAQMVIMTRKIGVDLFYPSLLPLTYNHVLDAIFLSAFYWLLPARRKGWLWLLVFLVTLWCFVHITYNETYHDMMPFSSWLYWSNLGTVVFDSVLGTITPEAIAVVVLPLVLLVVYLIFLRKRVSRDTKFSRRRWLLALVTLLLPVMVHGLRLVAGTVRHGDTLKNHFAAKYYNFVNFRIKLYTVYNGNVPFIFYSIAKACQGVTAEERSEVEQFIEKEIPVYADNSYCAPSAKPRNVVLLLVESLNAWVVDLKIDGREVCPVLNSLVADTSAIATTQMMAQVKNGRSSDGMFIYNTGLLPLPVQSVAMDYGDNNYPALAKALKSVNPSYRTMEITVDRSGMWNVDHTAVSYGFDSLFLQDVYRDTYIKSQQSIDKTLLEFSSAEFAKQRQPFYAMVFTGTTHVPYDRLEDVMQPTWISQSKSYTRYVRNYLEKVAFFDRQLGAFIERMKRDGTYDNTVLIVASDHSDFIDDDPKGRASISERGIECVFVILNSGLPGRRIEGPVGQIDLYPTLLDLLGLNTYWWKGLGHSLLRTDVHSVAPAPGETAGDTSSPLLPHQQQAWKVSETIIKSNWWKKR